MYTFVHRYLAKVASANCKLLLTKSGLYKAQNNVIQNNNEVDGELEPSDQTFIEEKMKGQMKC